MYIPEFWCGAMATVVAEVVIIIIVAVWPRKK